LTYSEPFEAGVTLRLRKKHPCGNDCWQILSIGAYVEAQCLGCGKKKSFDPFDLRRLVVSRVNKS
jgi:hypothetical protein